jgi:hypothetical protein
MNRRRGRDTRGRKHLGQTRPRQVELQHRPTNSPRPKVTATRPPGALGRVPAPTSPRTFRPFRVLLTTHTHLRRKSHYHASSTLKRRPLALPRMGSLEKRSRRCPFPDDLHEAQSWRLPYQQILEQRALPPESSQPRREPRRRAPCLAGGVTWRPRPCLLPPPSPDFTGRREDGKAFVVQKRRATELAPKPHHSGLPFPIPPPG